MLQSLVPRHGTALRCEAVAAPSCGRKAVNHAGRGQEPDVASVPRHATQARHQPRRDRRGVFGQDVDHPCWWWQVGCMRMLEEDGERAVRGRAPNTGNGSMASSTLRCACFNIHPLTLRPEIMHEIPSSCTAVRPWRWVPLVTTRYHPAVSRATHISPPQGTKLVLPSPTHPPAHQIWGCLQT